ncbi:F-box protein [Acorus calamus]|uniref:F-box protein n=1 Tax=Acorus calamus TaxID=4465 RepID=A0AAV9FDH1_ACOCL|nr:F-box protein [Acorus calamus]
MEDLHPDLLLQILRRLDPPILAAVSASSSHLLRLSSDPHLLHHLSLSTWPSLRHLPTPYLHLLSSKSFLSDAFPSPSSAAAGSGWFCGGDLISAVDLYHNHDLLLSSVIVTDTSDPWFSTSPFRIDAPAPAADASAVDPVALRLTWIAIDSGGGHRRRAADLSSRRPVSVQRHWLTGDMQVRFATVLGPASVAAVVVTCGRRRGEGEEEGCWHVREASLVVEDVEGFCLNGREGLAVIEAAMGGGRRRKAEGEAGERWSEFLRRRRERRAWKLGRERRLDTCCVMIGVSALVSFWGLLVWSHLSVPTC